jgi:hypothetical protein
LRKLRLMVNGEQAATLPVDPLAALFSRGLIDMPCHLAGRRYAFLTALERRAWHLQEGSVGPLWERFISGTVSDIGISYVSAGNGNQIESARGELHRMNQELAPPGDVDHGQGLFMVRALAVDNSWLPWVKRRILRLPPRPRDDARLAVLNRALERLVAMTRPPNRHKPLDAEQFCA